MIGLIRLAMMSPSGDTNPASWWASGSWWRAWHLSVTDVPVLRCSGWRGAKEHIQRSVHGAVSRIRRSWRPCFSLDTYTIYSAFSSCGKPFSDCGSEWPYWSVGGNRYANSPPGIKGYLHGLLEAGTQLKVTYRTGDVGLKECRKRLGKVDEDDEMFKFCYGSSYSHGVECPQY